MNFRPRITLVFGLVAATIGSIGAADQPVDRVKVIAAGPASARALSARGARLLVNYGAFQLIETSEKPADLAATNGLEVRADLDRVELNTGTIQTQNAAAQSIRRPVSAFSGKRLHLVQFIGPILPKWHALLRGSGVEIVSYIPQNTYLVYGDVASLRRVQASSELAAVLQWDGGFLDEYKIQPAARLLESSGKRQDQRAICSPFNFTSTNR